MSGDESSDSDSSSNGDTDDESIFERARTSGPGDQGRRRLGRTPRGRPDDRLRRHRGAPLEEIQRRWDRMMMLPTSAVYEGVGNGDATRGEGYTEAGRMEAPAITGTRDYTNGHARATTASGQEFARRLEQREARFGSTPRGARGNGGVSHGGGSDVSGPEVAYHGWNTRGSHGGHLKPGVNSYSVQSAKPSFQQKLPRAPSVDGAHRGAAEAKTGLRTGTKEAQGSSQAAQPWHLTVSPITGATPGDSSKAGGPRPTGLFGADDSLADASAQHGAAEAATGLQTGSTTTGAQRRTQVATREAGGLITPPPDEPRAEVRPDLQIGAGGRRAGPKGLGSGLSATSEAFVDASKENATEVERRRLADGASAGPVRRRPPLEPTDDCERGRKHARTTSRGRRALAGLSRQRQRWLHELESIGIRLDSEEELAAMGAQR